MDFRLTDAQLMLVNTARDFLRRRWTPSLVQDTVSSEPGFPVELWKEISVLGWPGLLIPPDLGGSGGSALDVALLVEEMGRACFPSPYVQSAVVGTSLLLAAGSRAQRERLLPAMAQGDRLCTLALVEESGCFEPDGIALEGEIGGRLDGRKLFVKDAHIADDLVVVARGAAGVNLLLLETRRPGVQVLPMETISGEKLWEVAFSGVEVRAEDLLGEAGSGSRLLAPALRIGALARSAEMVGCAQRILELCVDHVKVRRQFGRPIGSFQAIQHACADLLRDVEATRGLVHNAAWRMQEGRECAADVAMAKACAGAGAQAVARKAHQLFGAISYCEEHPLHLFHKRILAASLDFGDATAHLETVAREIGLV